jgi:chromate reductase
MPASTQVAVLVGSLRQASYNRKMAQVLIRLAPPTLALEIVEIRDLPPYDQDQEQSPPPVVTAFKSRIEAAHALLFVTPEYNRSVPGVLKNAIDWASRPYGHSAWNGKPGAVVSVSTGAIGGFGANHHLRQSMVFLNVPMMCQPEAYIGNAATLFDETGEVSEDETRKFLMRYMQAFADWVGRHVGN